MQTTPTAAGSWALADLLRRKYRLGPNRDLSGSTFSGPAAGRHLEFVVDRDSSSVLEAAAFDHLTAHPQIEPLWYSHDGPPDSEIIDKVSGYARGTVAPGWLHLNEFGRGHDRHWTVIRDREGGWSQGGFDLGLVTGKRPQGRTESDVRRALPILAAEQGGARFLVSSDRTDESALLAYRKSVTVLSDREFELLIRLFRRRIELFDDSAEATQESEATYFARAAVAYLAECGIRWELENGAGQREVFARDVSALLDAIIRRCSWLLQERDLLFAELLSRYERTAQHQELRRFEALMVQLHAVMEGSARLAHVVHLSGQKPFQASWGTARWREALLTADPTMVDLVNAPSPLLPALDLVRALRNPLHGEGLTRVIAHHRDRPYDQPERLVHIPADEKVNGEITAAIAALAPDPNPLTPIEGGWLAEIGPVVEWLTPIALQAIDALVGRLVPIPDPLPHGMELLESSDPFCCEHERQQQLRLSSLGIFSTI